MDTSNEFVVGTNKKAALKFSIIALFLGPLGIMHLTGIIKDSYIIGDLLPISTRAAGIILLSVALLAIWMPVSAYKTRKRLRLTREGIHFPTKEFLAWDQIDHCEVNGFHFLPITINIKPKGGKMMAIPWMWVDCGMDKLAEMINSHIAEDDSADEVTEDAF
ncbi:MAG: hypothetical protein JXR40_08550 [Pontiellaceae bacterium]|nr:hypothetical protein [Pontiellaceae bacterium]